MNGGGVVCRFVVSVFIVIWLCVNCVVIMLVVFVVLWYIRVLWGVGRDMGI